eukprot:792793-Prorocentrum_minimum.AAC.2
MGDENIRAPTRHTLWEPACEPITSAEGAYSNTAIQREEGRGRIPSADFADGDGGVAAGTAAGTAGALTLGGLGGPTSAAAASTAAAAGALRPARSTRYRLNKPVFFVPLVRVALAPVALCRRRSQARGDDGICPLPSSHWITVLEYAPSAD